MIERGCARVRVRSFVCRIGSSAYEFPFALAQFELKRSLSTFGHEGPDTRDTGHEGRHEDDTRDDDTRDSHLFLRTETGDCP